MVTESSDSPRKKRASDDRSTAFRSGRFILTWVPIIISFSALFVAIQTYYVAHRPYVGVILADLKIITGDKKTPIGMAWNFVMKNTGASPALVVLEKNVARLIRDDNVTTLPPIGTPRGSMLLMPNQTSNIPGHFTDAAANAKAADVLSGRTVLTVDIELHYSTIGWFWWKNNFIYRIRNRYRHDYVPPSFIMESAYAD